MVVGVLRLELLIPENHSLKGKRAAIRPLLAALHREFGVSVAEVAEQDTWQRATIGVSIVSSDRRHADSVLSAVLDRAAGWSGDAMLGGSRLEMVDVG
jgi:uncharacterized protein YlxP (DUF503 family)